MKPNGLTLRNLGVLAAMDAFFAAAFTAMLSRVFGIDAAPTAVISAAFSGLRILGYWRLFERYVRPTEVFHQRLARGQQVTDDTLRDADRLLQQATRVVTAFASLTWAIALPATVVVYGVLVGPTGLHALESWTAGALVPVGLLGPIGIVDPLLTWGLAAGFGWNHVRSVERGSDLERPSRSLAMRVAVLGVCLTGVPTFLMMSATLATVDRAAFAVARHDARILTELVSDHLDRGVTGLPELEELHGSERSTGFVVAPGGEPRFVGARPPAWAKAAALTAAVDPSFDAPEREVASHAVALSDGTVVGAFVRAERISPEVVGLLVSVLALSALFAMSAAWLLARSVAGPLQRTAEIANRAAREGDLTQIGIVPVSQLDEVGLVMSGLHELIDVMRGVAQAAGAVGEGKLTVEIEGRGELPDSFRKMVEQLRSVVREILGASVEFAGAAMEILAASQEQEAATTSHSTGMTEISQTMGSLAASAAHVASAVQGVLENAERTLKNTDQMVARIDELTGHANRIGDILDVIREIADRTDLLALNGSLEASRAGEAGVGFSLVAAEMRRLAERVTASVGSIKTLVADIRESGASTVVATEESKKLADGTTQAARKITLVTQQQQSSTEQVTQNVRSVAEVIQLAATATSQTKESAEGLKRQADRLMELAQRFQLE